MEGRETGASSSTWRTGGTAKNPTDLKQNRFPFRGGLIHSLDEAVGILEKVDGLNPVRLCARAIKRNGERRAALGWFRVASEND